MKKKSIAAAVTQREMELLERLRQHPEMMERVREILAIAVNENGPLKTADEVEELLVEAMRRLGNETMGQWANQAEERVSREVKEQDPTVRSRKKKR